MLQSVESSHRAPPPRCRSRSLTHGDTWRRPPRGLINGVTFVRRARRVLSIWAGCRFLLAWLHSVFLLD
ncbi:hypothetical protein AAFF_G00114730 [Aldrovandia affinis]|uniref:Uncharacterized protein n=1 Tax=Aldrovandia affinis TaxID=143900 RepID=A0AAD7RT56_9TELE|nr:hypothetical protein AAFF_G00114730 [Aldrovandia affinis]